MPQSPHHGNHNPQQRQQQDRQAPTLPAITFSGKLDPELFNSKARQAAQAVASAHDRNKPTQLRRFYDELCMWEEKVARSPKKFDEYLPFIRMLNAKAAYAEGRKLVDRTFVELFQKTLAEVKDPPTLTTCKLFWEAFMGFYKQERPN